MVWLKRGLTLFAGLLGLLAVIALGYVWRSFPALDGRLRVAGLEQGVRIERDAADVTHIKASTPHDAWFSMGYVHAQERSWQLAFNRRLMHGRLSELLGPATLETDKLLRTLGIMQAAQQQWQGLPAESRAALQAYSDGINAFFASSPQALPPEFHVLGAQPLLDGTAWQPQDSVAWSLMMALDLGGNWGQEFARLSAAKVLTTAQLWQLFPPYPGDSPAASKDLAKCYTELGVYRNVQAEPRAQVSGSAVRAAAQANAWAQDWGNAEGKGSNNWVVAGSRSTSGKPLLANDPHLGLSAPAIWYFARVKLPGMDVIGATLPGLPFVVLGRTAQVAWGFTNTGPDVQDLYLEQINPANSKQYKTPDGWADFSTRMEVIKVKGQGDVSLTVRATRHGPVLSDVQASHAELLDTAKFVLALRWSALEADNQTVHSSLKANQAQSVDDLLAAFASYHSPMQNLLAADTAGRIAFKVIGQAPVRRADNDIRGWAPSPGWDARYDWTGWLPYAQTPADTGSKGWIATANQRIHGPDYPHFLGADWTGPERFDRIENLLGAQAQHDPASMQAIQGDQLSLATQRLLPYLQKTTSTHPLADAAQVLLKNFDGVMRANAAAPLIFSVWIDELTRAVIGSKLGQARFAALYGKRHFRQAMEGILARDDGDWCGQGGCAAASSAALNRALDSIALAQGRQAAQWQWGAAHPALSVHRPFGNVASLAHFFDVRVPTGGDTFTVNVGQYHTDKADAPFANRHAASLRALYDLANLENSRFIFQTGQSGLVFSSRYRDMAKDWADLQYRPLQLNPAEIRHALDLTP